MPFWNEPLNEKTKKLTKGTINKKMELRQLRQKAKGDCVGWLTHREDLV